MYALPVWARSRGVPRQAAVCTRQPLQVVVVLLLG
jgi:hypothetical protein